MSCVLCWFNKDLSTKRLSRSTVIFALRFSLHHVISSYSLQRCSLSKFLHIFWLSSCFGEVLKTEFELCRLQTDVIVLLHFRRMGILDSDCNLVTIAIIFNKWLVRWMLYRNSFFTHRSWSFDVLWENVCL